MKTVKEKLIIRFYNIFIHRWLRWKIFVSEKSIKVGISKLEMLLIMMNLLIFVTFIREMIIYNNMYGLTRVNLKN